MRWSLMQLKSLCWPKCCHHVNVGLLRNIARPSHLLSAWGRGRWCFESRWDSVRKALKFSIISLNNNDWFKLNSKSSFIMVKLAFIQENSSSLTISQAFTSFHALKFLIGFPSISHRSTSTRRAWKLSSAPDSSSWCRAAVQGRNSSRPSDPLRWE